MHLRKTLIRRALDLERRGQSEGTADFAVNFMQNGRIIKSESFFVNITLLGEEPELKPTEVKFVFVTYKKKWGTRWYSLMFIVKCPLKLDSRITEKSIAVQVIAPYDGLGDYHPLVEDLKKEIIELWNA